MSQANPADQSNWRASPHNRWAFHNVDRILPTAPVANDPARISALPMVAEGLGHPNGREMPFDATDTDAVVVLHHGETVFEWYGHDNDAHTPHILMSATKAVVGLLAAVLQAKGVLDLEAPVSTYLPEIAATSYRSATIRHLLDMRTGIDFDARQLQAYDAAVNWQPLAEGEADAGLAAFFEAMPATPVPHGGPFRYISANTDLLGWAIERATGRSIATLLSEELWKPLGAEDGGYVTLDRRGLERCAGGFCATARDLARLGRLIADDGQVDGTQVVPVSVIDDLMDKGDPEAWRTGEWGKSFSFISPNMRYRNGWYVVDDQPRTLFAMGIHGQNLFVDRANKIVMVKFSSWKQRIDHLALGLTHRSFERLQQSLAAEG